nr:12287_t:CDS:2 [Entrophospora candida]
MGRLNKITKSCKNARLAKSSRTCKPLVLIDTNSIIVDISIPNQNLKDQTMLDQTILDPNNNTIDFSCTPKLSFFDLNMSSLENGSESSTFLSIDNISESLDTGTRNSIEFSDPLDVQTEVNIESLSENSNLHNIHPTHIFPGPFNNNKVERIRKDLIGKINYLSEKELVSCSQLFVNMVHKDGLHKGDILSPYLQKKASEWVLANRGKSNANSQEKDQEIRLLKAKNSQLKRKIDKLTPRVKSLAIKLRHFERSKNNRLPNGLRASEMPDKVEKWIDEFQIAIEHVEEVFIEELLLAHEVLPENEFFDLTNKIENGLVKASETFKKWMHPWMHLPLSICRLGGAHGPDFAFAIAKVVVNIDFLDEPTNIQKKYMDQLINDLEVGKRESFGLFQALENNEFQEQFLDFSRSTHTELANYPLVWEFVKNKIWYIIVHQQHLEGMFNRYDLKTHPNMSIDLQEAKMKLSDPKKLGTLITKENLSEVRSKRKQKEVIDKNDPTNREEAAIKLLEKFLKPSK